ncbi:SLATT domain-containing protein [Pseudomonas sp. DP-17]|nr:SLATT domain-containing protein [Pseudomonas sp. DP-17]
MRLIAEKAYDVGYSAKLHFSTYDIVEKSPGWIGLISTVVGILSLIIAWLAEKQMSAAITILGVSGLYIAFYADKKDEYFKVGQKLTGLFNRLKKLSAECSSLSEITADHLKELEDVESEFNSICMSKHIFGASWLAHKKFFWEQQVSWIDEQVHFEFFKDKVPFSVYVIVVSLALALVVWVFRNIEWFAILRGVCS